MLAKGVILEVRKY